MEKNTAIIEKNSDNNTIIQDSILNNPVICSNTADLLNVLGQAGQYGVIQKQYSEFMSSVKQTHPLYPVFSASLDRNLDKLVSTPETKDAFDKFPKTIKGEFRIDYKKYPHMDKSETPWDYAYRTQTTVSMETTAYQEYLGDIPDPFPVTEYEDGMITIIGAPEFPPAIEAFVVSGEITIPIMIQRKPCMEYGKMLFGTVTSESGFEFNIETYKNENRTDFKITNVRNCELDIRLQREKLYSEFLKTKSMSILIGENHLTDYTFNDTELENSMFLKAPILERYIECLLMIENHTKCKFSVEDAEFTEDNYNTALILAASFEGKWHREILEFDDQLRCSFDKIPENLVDIERLSAKSQALEIPLQGVTFSAKEFVIFYEDAKINNINSVIKNKMKRKKKILLTFRPINGKKTFCKYYRFEDPKLISN